MIPVTINATIVSKSHKHVANGSRTVDLPFFPSIGVEFFFGSHSHRVEQATWDGQNDCGKVRCEVIEVDDIEFERAKSEMRTDGFDVQ